MLDSNGQSKQIKQMMSCHQTYKFGHPPCKSAFLQAMVFQHIEVIFPMIMGSSLPLRWDPQRSNMDETWKKDVGISKNVKTEKCGSKPTETYLLLGIIIMIMIIIIIIIIMIIIIMITNMVDNWTYVKPPPRLQLEDSSWTHSTWGSESTSPAYDGIFGMA